MRITEAVKRTVSVALGTSAETVASACGEFVLVSVSGKEELLVAPTPKSVSNPDSPIGPVGPITPVELFKMMQTSSLFLF